MKILIVGAGAAGMMAAATIAENSDGAQVCLVEKNTILGRKVIISGGGRCNLTTAENDIPVLMKAYPRGSRWLKFCMHEFPPAKVCEWFEKHGIALKAEGSKIYPVSNKGTDVTEMFERILEEENVEVLLGIAVEKVEKEGEGFKVSFNNGDERDFDRIILTTGGSAYRHTGSTGDGYSFAEALGHTVKPIAATLTSFSAADEWVSDLPGVSIENAKFKLVGKEKNEFSGPFLFTHKGVSGPAIFALSSLSAFEECTKESPLKLYIDFVPDTDYQSLTNQIQYDLEKNSEKLFSKILNVYLPKSVLSVIFDRLKIEQSKCCFEVSKKDLTRVVESLKNFEMTLNERTPGAEIVTAGGVDLSEVDQKTMESKICPGLFFGGELLDTDGFTGGYNLQIAWATGRLAGISAIY